MIYSFDIFDTLVTRATGTPAGIFNVMQKEMLERAFPIPISKVREFRNIRVYSARQAYADKRPLEVTLDEIYTKVGECVQLSSEIITQLKDLEIECEIASAIPIHQNLTKAFAAISDGQRVILIADTYHSTSTVQKILDRLDPMISKSVSFYLSSEIGLTLRSGGLYRFIAEKEKVKYSEISHLGDDIRSDYLVPKNIGINARQTKIAHLRRWETLGVLAECDGCAAAGSLPPWNRSNVLPPLHFPQLSTDAVSSWELVSGLSRKARLSGVSEKYLLGYSWAAPILIPFTYWVLREATSREINRLYFVARDGQIFFKIARLLQQRGVAPEVELRYLYGSRRAWHLPSFQGFDNHDLFWVIDSRHGLTLRKLSARLGIDINELIAALELNTESKTLVQSPDNVLSQSEISNLPKVLRSNERLIELVTIAAGNARQLLVDYLNQEGWNDADLRSAIVDIGWSGRSQDSLFRALSGVNPTPKLTGFYFGLHCHTTMTSETNRKVPFALSPHHFHLSPNGHQFFQVIHILECLTAADHGATVSYERKGAKVVPKLDQQGQAVANWGLEQHQKGILDFAREITLGEELLNTESIRSRLRDVRWYMFEQYPEAEITRALGSYPFTPEMDGSGQKEFAPKLSLPKAVRYLTIAPRHRSSISSWINGSYVRSEFLSRIFISKPSLVISSVVFHPVHSAAAGLRLIKRHLPISVRKKLLSLIPLKHVQQVQDFISGRKPSNKM